MTRYPHAPCFAAVFSKRTPEARLGQRASQRDLFGAATSVAPFFSPRQESPT